MCVGQEIPEDCSDYNQSRHVADEMAEFLPIVQGLSRHNCSVHNARPDRERNQTAMLRRVARRQNKKYTQNRIDPADHLQVVLAVPPMPDPPRRPDQAHRVNEKEDHAESTQCQFEQVVFGYASGGHCCHVNLLCTGAGQRLSPARLSARSMRCAIADPGMMCLKRAWKLRGEWLEIVGGHIPPVDGSLKSMKRIHKGEKPAALPVHNVQPGRRGSQAERLTGDAGLNGAEESGNENARSNGIAEPWRLSENAQA